MPVYPGDPKASLEQVAHIEKDTYNDHKISTVMHVGTHMDAPLHMIAGGKRISDVPIETFTGPGVLIDARGYELIPATLLDQKIIPKGSILLILTGFSSKVGQPEYYESNPEISSDFAERAVKLGVKMVGMDMQSPDRPPFPVHKILLGNDVLILENLTNLEALLNADSFTITALPLKIPADASPARVIAITD